MKTFLLLTPGETLELDVRAPLLLWIPRFVIGGAWTLAPLFFIALLLREGTVGVFLFVVLLVSGLMFLFSSWRRFSRTRFVVTSLRVVWMHQRGVFSKDVEEMPLARLKSVQARQRGLSALFGYGKIRVETEGGARTVSGMLPRVRAIQEKILFLLAERPSVSRL
ncbi:PH domain-containing protein [Candidatus Uhrbacteria bacterium]|nr:PH domain-containing protein [Candidatus Uhrbacteria bacterium]